MTVSAVVDSSYLVALLARRDTHHEWAEARALAYPPPWQTCEAVVSEAFHLMGNEGASQLADLLRRSALIPTFDLRAELDAVLPLMAKYAPVPMSLADACLVRMTETLADPIVLTTDTDFRIYRRHSRQVVPCVLPD